MELVIKLLLRFFSHHYKDGQAESSTIYAKLMLSVIIYAYVLMSEFMLIKIGVLNYNELTNTRFVIALIIIFIFFVLHFILPDSTYLEERLKRTTEDEMNELKNLANWVLAVTAIVIFLPPIIFGGLVTK